MTGCCYRRRSERVVVRHCKTGVSIECGSSAAFLDIAMTQVGDWWLFTFSSRDDVSALQRATSAHSFTARIGLAPFTF
jgi:hypothetical protein